MLPPLLTSFDVEALEGALSAQPGLPRGLLLDTPTQGWIETALTGRDFINGEHPSGGDFTLYSTLWFAGNGGFDFRPFPQLNAWRKRMKAFGRGQASAFR